jgi:hypothetical protein
MVDYDRAIGGNVTLRIRDYGQLIEFWMLADRYTWNYQQPWSWQVNGGSGSGIFRLEKTGKWQRVAQFGVSTDQDVRFTMIGSGLGFSTYNFVQHINRTRVPPAPSPVYFSNLTATSVRAMFNSSGTGGLAILEWQLAYGTNPYTAQYYVGSGGVTDIGGLAPGTRYYFWARGRNALGWGSWSVRTEVQTHQIPDQPNPVRFANRQQTSLNAYLDYAGRWNGGLPLLEWQIGYGLDPDSFSTLLSGSSVDISSMLVAGHYYFWGRVRNEIGWSDWSTKSEVDLVAGAYISVDGIPHRAIPWVKAGGVWRVAKPWVNVDGIWRSTQ